MPKKQITSSKKTLKNYKIRSSFKTHKEGPDRVLMATANGQFVKLSHGNVHYNFYNSKTNKPLILCIHGINSNNATWTEFAIKCNKLGYPVLCPDLYGRGLSEGAGVKNNLDLFVSQLDELIIYIYSTHSNLKLSNGVYVIGMSLGGAIAAGFTSKYSNIVKKTVLVAPAGLIKQPLYINFAIMLGIHKLMGKIINKERAIKLHEKNSVYNVDDPEVKKFINELADETIRLQQHHKGNDKAIQSTISNFEFGGLLNTYKQINKNKTPLLVIWGDKDMVCPFSGLDVIKAHVSNLKTVVLNNCGHLDLWILDRYKMTMYNSAISFFNK